MAHPTADRNYRLPRTVLPSRYGVELSIDPAAKSFSGRLVIDLELSEPTDEIVLHAIELTLARATLRGDGQPVEARIDLAPASETAILRFPRKLAPGKRSLEIDWSGRFCEGLRGLYQAGSVAVTQFEAADARRLFPCFDEPAFKARWALSLELPQGLVALSNGAQLKEEPRGDRRRVTFAETPPLSSYLIAIAAGPLVASPEQRAREVSVRSWAVAEKAHLASFAQEVAVNVLPRLEDYFGLPYAFGKLDQVGIPDFEAGAMENAGLVTYREVALLLDPATASLPVQKRVAEVITHELSHQWFGNWVTMAWWDDLWLNEAFATWMAYKIVDGWKPEWRVWLDFDAGKASALQLDALRSTHPIRAEVHNASEATESFDAITYEKGGAVLRMIEGYLGEGPFKEGIRAYMRRHAKANATADDLWGALAEASKEPVPELAGPWLRQGGYPLVTAAVVGRRLTVSQRRFFSEPGVTGPERWPVPLVLRYRDGSGVREQRLLLREATQEVTLEGSGEIAWLCANAGATGFYRVAYAEPDLRRLAGKLSELAPSERIALLSDGWALCRANLGEVGTFLDLIRALGSLECSTPFGLRPSAGEAVLSLECSTPFGLRPSAGEAVLSLECSGPSASARRPAEPSSSDAGGEADHAVLDELVSRLAILEHRLLPESDRARFTAFVEGLLGPQLVKVGWSSASGESDGERLRRAALVQALGLVARSQPVVAEASRRLDRFLAGDAHAVDANLQDAVVALAARGGDAARFDGLLARYLAEADPAFKRRYLMALARFEDPTLCERAQELAFSDTVPMQDFAGFAATLLGNRAARDGFWRKIQGRWEAILGKTGGAPMLFRRVVEALGQLPERRHLDEVTRFLAAHPVDAARQAATQTLERMAQDVALRERLMEPVGAWLRARPS